MTQQHYRMCALFLFPLFIIYLYNIHQFGVFLTNVKAISLSGPTPEDLESTNQLEMFLHDHHMYETEEEKNKRTSVLEELTAIVQSWAQALSMQKVVVVVVVFSKRNRIEKNDNSLSFFICFYVVHRALESR
jgi:hypothetical protein